MKITSIATGSSGNCYQVQFNGGHQILIEAGVPVKKLREKIGSLADIKACLVSHEHGDHAGYVKQLIKRSIDCYGPNPVFDGMDPDYHIKSAYHPVRVGGIDIVSFGLVHDVENLGYCLIGQGFHLVYITDTAYIPVRLRGLTHIMVECNYDHETINKNVDSGLIDPGARTRIRASHMALETLVVWLESTGLDQVSEIHLIHMSDRNCNQEKAVRTIQECTGKLVLVH